MYHIVLVIGGGMFSLNVDNSFLKFKNNPSAVSFPFTAVVSVGNGLTTRVIGEKISSSSVTSYQISLMGIGVSLCFGLIEILDINSVTLDGGDYQTHWGPCSSGFGSMCPTGLIGWVCPCAPCDAQCTKCFGAIICSLTYQPALPRAQLDIGRTIQMTSALNATMHAQSVQMEPILNVPLATQDITW